MIVNPTRTFVSYYNNVRPLQRLGSYIKESATQTPENVYIAKPLLITGGIIAGIGILAGIISLHQNLQYKKLTDNQKNEKGFD